jgi:hypothetical protein
MISDLPADNIISFTIEAVSYATSVGCVLCAVAIIGVLLLINYLEKSAP